MEKKPSDMNDAVAALGQMRSLLVATGGDRKEGIFRVSAKKSHQEKAFASFKQGDFSPSVTDDPHAIAMSIKQWCRTCGVAPVAADTAASSVGSPPQRSPLSSGSRFLRPASARPARSSNPTRRKSILDRVRHRRRHTLSDATDVPPPGLTSPSASSSSSASSMEPSTSESVVDSRHSEVAESRGGGAAMVAAGKCLLHEVDLDVVSKLRASDMEALERILGAVSPVNRETYNVVVDICADIAANEYLTRMSPKNLAIVFAPNVFDYDGARDILRLNVVMRACQQFMELCIQTHLSERSAVGARARESAHFPQPMQLSLSPRGGARSRSPELPSPVQLLVSPTLVSHRIAPEYVAAGADESPDMSLAELMSNPRSRSQQNTPTPTMQKRRSQTVASRRSKTMRKLSRALSLVSPPSTHSEESLENIQERSEKRPKTGGNSNASAVPTRARDHSTSATPPHSTQPSTSVSGESSNFQSLHEKFSAMSKNKMSATSSSGPSSSSISTPPIPPRLPQRSFVAPSKPSHMPTLHESFSPRPSKASTSAPPRTVTPSLLNSKSSRKSRLSRPWLDSEESVGSDSTDAFPSPDRMDAKASDDTCARRPLRLLGINVSASDRLKALGRVKSSPMPIASRDRSTPASTLSRQSSAQPPKAAAVALKRRNSLPLTTRDSESWKMVSIYVAALHSLSKKHEGAQQELVRCREELAATKRQLAELRTAREGNLLRLPKVAHSGLRADWWSSRSSVASADEGLLQEEKISGAVRRRPRGGGNHAESASQGAKMVDHGSQTDLSSFDGITLEKTRAAPTTTQRVLALVSAGVFVGFSFLRLRRYFCQAPNHHAW